MRLGTRIFLGYFALVGAGMMVFLYSATEQLRPAIRQASEETMVDAANLLAELAAEQWPDGFDAASPFSRALTRYRQREPNATIWLLQKSATDLSVYVTDAAGIVLFHSDPRQVGEDYSQWNDVARTLRGEYGARTTPSDPDDALTSEMYVAAPVRRDGRIVGVLTLSQPNASAEPFLDFARRQTWQTGTVILIIALLLGAALSVWLTRSIRRLVTYVERVRDGERATPPHLAERELARLAESTERMRQEIEGKRYVEQYIQTLAHEMKSPLSAVQGAAELMRESDLPAAERDRFLENIRVESGRMRHLIDRLLSLAAVEKLNELGVRDRVDLTALLAEQTAAKYVFMEQRQLQLAQALTERPVHVVGDALLLQQAVSNLLDNAIEFAHPGTTLEVALSVADGQVQARIVNTGDGIPDYAWERIFERFYSLARPNGGRKSTGLGLSFVREVAGLHGGRIHIDNIDRGRVQATLMLPCVE